MKKLLMLLLIGNVTYGYSKDLGHLRIYLIA